MATQMLSADLQIDRAFVARAMKAPYLEQEQEYDLVRRWREKGDQKALHQLIEAYYRLVIKVASKFRHYGLPLGDLAQEGAIGLLQAASRFEVERGLRFSTYATWWIRSAMQEYVLRNWSIVKSGSSATQKALFFKLRWLRARIEGRNEDVAPHEVRDQIAKALKVAPAEVEAMMLRLGARDQSLDLPVGEEGDETIGSFLPDLGPTPEQIVLERRDGEKRREWLHAAVEGLTPREKLIVERRQLADEAETLEEIGAVLGVTKERVRQIEQKALIKLRQAVLKQAHSRSDGHGPAQLADTRELEPA
jgi:RNA polymerase sigma-32 factor